MSQLFIRKDDLVQVMSGKDKGKQGKVLRVDPKNMKVLVEGVNVVRRHVKPSQKNPQGGILSKESPMHYSKVQLVDPTSKKPLRSSKFARGKSGELTTKKSS